MSGIKDFNRPAFNEAEAVLKANGYKVENPAKCSLPAGSEWKAYMKADIKALMSCDAIVMLPGWEKSKGAMIEYGIACDLGYEIHHYERMELIF